MLDKSILDNDLNEKVAYTDFFKAFGYEPKEQVYIRLFDDSKTDKNDMGRKMGQSADRFDGMVETLKRENSNRRGVYFVVNGGGNTDKEVLKSKCCKAQFAEMDDFSFEEQINRLNKFQYEPSIIVKTKKSLHCYWLLDNGNIKCFRPLQECFIKQFDGDPVIKNESRVMRLYGFNHCKQEPPVMVKLIKFNPEMRYSQEQLAKALPRVENTGSRRNRQNSQNVSNSTEIIPVGQRHNFVVRRCGELMNRIGDTTDDSSILALVEHELLSKCEDPDGIDLDDFRRKYLETIRKFRVQHEEEQKDPDFFKYARKAWLEENPGKEFDHDKVSWDEVREAGERAKQAGKQFDKGIQNDAAAPNTDEPFIDGKINKAFFHQWVNTKTGPVPKKPFDSRIRDYLPQKYSVIVFSGIPWIYVNGRWVKDETTAKLRYLIELFLYEEFKTDTYIRRIYELIIKTATLEKTWRDVNKQPKTWVNFKDCYVDLYDLTEHEHKPEYYTLNQIDIAWETVKAAGPGKITDDFLNFVIPNPDDREMLLEFFGYSLTSDNGQQKALILYGNGSTGKSTILNLERSILGIDNVSDVALQELGTRFKASRLVGMLANISADLPAASLKDSSTFKMITGNDAIDTERKGKDGFSFVNYAKMIFSTNGLPIIEGERSTGAFRRLLLISFQNAPTEKDPLLPEKLSHELPYFCQLIMHAGHRMYQRGYVLESANSENDIKQLRSDSDVTQAWLDECTETSDRHRQTSRQDLYTSFEMYCRSENRIALKPNSFYAALRAKGFMEYKKPNERGFYGIYANFGVRNSRS